MKLWRGEDGHMLGTFGGGSRKGHQQREEGRTPKQREVGVYSEKSEGTDSHSRDSPPMGGSNLLSHNRKRVGIGKNPE